MGTHHPSTVDDLGPYGELLPGSAAQNRLVIVSVDSQQRTRWNAGCRGSWHGRRGCRARRGGDAPALLIGGLTLSAQGEKAFTQARAYEAKVNVACAQMQTRIELFGELRRRIREMSSLLADLRRRAEASLAELQAVDFDPAQHAELFQRTALLMRALGEVLSTPLLDADGNPSDESITIIERHAP